MEIRKDEGIGGWLKAKKKKEKCIEKIVYKKVVRFEKAFYRKTTIVEYSSLR